MYKLLVADDENIIRKGIVETLRKSVEYFELYEAANGEEVLQIVDAEDIDALIVDIKMPKINGVTVLKRLWESNRNILSVVLTGYDEFDYAKSALEYGAMKYILKPMVPSQLLELAEELKENLDSRAASKAELLMLREEFVKNQKLQKEKILQDILWEDYSEEWLRERVRVLDIKLQGPYYQIAVLGIQQYKHPASKDAYLIDYSINLFLEEYFRENKDVEFFQLNSNKYIFLFNIKDTNEQSQNEYLYNLKEKIERQFKIVCAIGVGSVCENIRDIKFSYDSADTTIRYLNVQQFDCVLTAEEIKEENVQTDIVFDVDGYSIALMSGKTEEVLKIIDKFFADSNENAKGIDINGFYLTTAQIILATFQALFQAKGDIKELGMSELSAMQTLYQMNTPSDIKVFVTGLAEKVSHLIKEIKTDGRNNTIKKIKNIVNEEYSQPLSMKYIADKMYLNHIYLGQIFKKETGISLNDYINKVRINKAKKLLKESQAMVYEIAEQVGFSDPQYFSTVFKKNTGVSPKEYRDI